MMTSWKITATQWATNVRTLLAQLRGSGTEGDDDDAEPGDACEVVQPLGLRANPAITSTLEAFAIERGDQTIPVMMVDKARAAGGVEPDAGGTVLYAHGAQDCLVHLHAAGSVEITSSNGQTLRITATGPADIVFNGGGTPVAKEGSATVGHTHSFNYAWTGSAGSATGTTGSATDTIAAGAGSAHIKVP